MVYPAFSDQLSEPVAEVIMELLFTQPTTELGTQSDLHANTTLLRGEMAELRGELKAEFGNLYRWGAGGMVANGIAVITALLS